jgi:hypothetical protein
VLTAFVPVVEPVDPARVLAGVEGQVVAPEE